MKETTETGRDHLPCGMVSLKMFKINHSKALIIAYLDLRGGLKNYTFNWRDISNQTNIGRTVVNHYLNELVAEGVLNRKGKSFYKLNRQKMEELYYVNDWSDSDSNGSESDIAGSENDPNRSESDPKVSETDPIHSSNLNTSKLDSRNLDTSKLNTTAVLAALSPEQTSSFSLSAQLPDKILTVSGTSPKPSKNLTSAEFDKIFGAVLKKEAKETSSEPFNKSFEDQFADIFGVVVKKETKDSSASAAILSNNPRTTPQRTDTKEELNDSSARVADAARNNHPIPSARPGEFGELPNGEPKRSAVEELLSRPVEERLRWLDAIDANKTMAKDLRAGKNVPMTNAFADYFANL